MKDISKVRNYYVMVIMMAGVVDDFKDGLEQLVRAAKLPASLVFIKMGENTDDNDSSKFIEKALPAIQETERVFVDMLDFENYKAEGKHTQFYKEQLSFDILSTLPSQIEKFFTMHDYEFEVEAFSDEKLQAALNVSMTGEADLTASNKLDDKVLFASQQLDRRDE